MLQDIFLAGSINISINLCGSDGAVSQKLLDTADIDLLIHKKGGKGMPEHMRCDMKRNPGIGSNSADHIAHGLL